MMTAVPVFAIVMFVHWTGNAEALQPSAEPSVAPANCVPMWVVEKQICKQTRYRTEERQRTCTVCRKVPVVKEGIVKYTAYVEKEIENKREIEISTPVAKWVEQKYKVLVPAKDKVTKTRVVKKCVPVTETRRVCENGVEKDITVTCCQETCVAETYECEVDVCAEVEQTRKVIAYDTKKEKKVVTDRCKTVVAVPKTKKVAVTVCEEVTEEKVETYTVCVPYEVEVEVDVGVLKMVAADGSACP